MATKKTVKKAPAVVKATPEVQEVRSDGEYNKYPVYHGCIIFDDDNIVEVNIINGTPSFKYNGEEIEKAPAYIDSINYLGKISNNVINQFLNRNELIYNEASFGSYSGSTLGWLTATDETRAIAIKNEITQGISAYSAKTMDIWFNAKPYTIFSSNPSRPNNINIHFCFDQSLVTEEELSTWGITGSGYHITYNDTFPTREEFFEMYGG